MQATVLIFMGFLCGALSAEDMQSCFKNPCQNEGKCKMVRGSKQVVCECPIDFSGPTCELRNKCTFRHVVKGVKDTSKIDIYKLTGLDKENVDNCKQRCQDTTGCRALIVKPGICNTYLVVPLSVEGVLEMKSEENRLYAVRRCFKRKDSNAATATTETKPTADEKEPANKTTMASEEKLTSPQRKDEL